MQHQLEMEGTIRSQLEQETGYLRDQLDQCVRKKGELEKETLELRCQMMSLPSEQSYTKQHCGDIQRSHQRQPEQLKLLQEVKAMNLPFRETSTGNRAPLQLLEPIVGPIITTKNKKNLTFVSQASPKLQDLKKPAKRSEVEERFEKLENELSRVMEAQAATQRELERSRQQHQQQVDTNKALERKLQR